MALKINEKYYKIVSHTYNGADLMVECDIYFNEQTRVAEKKYLQDILNFKLKAEQLLNKLSNDIKLKIQAENIITEEQLKFSSLFKETVMFDNMQAELNGILDYILDRLQEIPTVHFLQSWVTCGFNENFLDCPLKKIGGVNINLGVIDSAPLTIAELYELIKPKFIGVTDC